MALIGNIITLIFLVLMVGLSFRKWKGLDSHWPKLRRHGGNRDTFETIEFIAMCVFIVSLYNVVFMFLNIIVGIPNAYQIDIVINFFIFLILFLMCKKVVKKHELRGRNPLVVQTIIGSFNLSFIGAEFWLKHHAPDFIVKLVKSIM